MPALAKTAHVATITWLGLVADRAAALPSHPVEALELGFDGPLGESHGGMTRPSCSRVLGLYPRNTPIRTPGNSPSSRPRSWRRSPPRWGSTRSTPR